MINRTTRELATIIAILTLVHCTNYFPMIGKPDIENGKTTIENGVLIHSTENYGMTIIGFSEGFDIIYEPTHPISLKEAAEKHPCSYIINGSYFEDSRVHAGWLSIFGAQIAPLKADRQLTHMAVFDPGLGYLDFPSLDLWDSSMTSATSIEFQTGPLVIHANQIDTLSIVASINGGSSHLRTFLAFTEEDAMKYFIITRRTGPLDKMAEHLLSLPVFEGKTLSVMNLDGGSSTALYARMHPELNYNINRPLPILLGIR